MIRCFSGRKHVWICGLLQYVSFYGTVVAYVVTISTCMSCYHNEGRDGDCEYGGNTYMLLFGVVQILMSHILDFHSMVLVSVVAAIMAFCYSSIGRKISATRLIHRTPSHFLEEFFNVPPAVLVWFLREHRSEWADFNVDTYSAALVKASPYGYQGTRPTRFTGSQTIMPLGLTIEHEEVMPLVKKILLCQGTFISYSYAAESMRMQWVEC
ncbi:putative amino acid transporter, transmembrane domain-containing protein [Helianthus anomalus]